MQTNQNEDKHTYCHNNYYVPRKYNHPQLIIEECIPKRIMATSKCVFHGNKKYIIILQALKQAIRIKQKPIMGRSMQHVIPVVGQHLPTQHGDLVIVAK